MPKKCSCECLGAWDAQYTSEGGGGRGYMSYLFLMVQAPAEKAAVCVTKVKKVLPEKASQHLSITATSQLISSPFWKDLGTPCLLFSLGSRQAV